MIKRCLISVSDKRGLLDFAKGLEALGIEILSTGGTAQSLRDAKVLVTDVSSVTGFPAWFDGRVKTLHPAIHGGILAIRDNPTHQETLKTQKILPIDLVVVNLYPFKETIQKSGVTREEAIENIDIGGPAMIRSAAKNHAFVSVLTCPLDYPWVLDTLREKGALTPKERSKLAFKAFSHTAQYDAMIASYLADEPFPDRLTITLEKQQEVRYGENPHQRAAVYRETLGGGALLQGEKLQGKELSFNNINDTHAALELLSEFEAPTIVAVKHTNPCGVASGKDIHEAYLRAYEADPTSIFGGIVVSNRPLDKETAEKMNEVFLEVIAAPDFTKEALLVFRAKKNLRVLKISCEERKPSFDLKRIQGGLLIQEPDTSVYEELQFPTRIKPTEEELADLAFAFKVVKHTRSNAIVLAKNKQTLAIGPGQTSRIWALEAAIGHSIHPLKGSVLASDAFFPFADCVEVAARAGIGAIIQPGGSLRDEDSIKVCDREGISMVFTGMRHFKH